MNNTVLSIFKKKKWLLIISFTLLVLLGGGHHLFTKHNLNRTYQIGDVIDELNGVAVYYNGGFAHVEGRNTTSDGYNLGLKYQCVEFVKRYYYEYFNHKMPDSYGHAKSFFVPSLEDGELNKQRGLLQFKNGSMTQPQESDLLVYKSTLLNRFGHVAIVSKVSSTEIEIIQQNPGPFGSSRETFPLIQNEDGSWQVEYDRIVGFLRVPE